MIPYSIGEPGNHQRAGARAARTHGFAFVGACTGRSRTDVALLAVEMADRLESGRAGAGGDVELGRSQRVPARYQFNGHLHGRPS